MTLKNQYNDILDNLRKIRYGTEPSYPLESLNNYDWMCAFEYAGEVGPGYGKNSVTSVLGSIAKTDPFTRKDVVEILYMREGENDGPDWLGLFRLRDGRYAYLKAGCDYTGWD